LAGLDPARLCGMDDMSTGRPSGLAIREIRWDGTDHPNGTDPIP
jgi:hypothetical protein